MPQLRREERRSFRRAFLRFFFFVRILAFWIYQNGDSRYCVDGLLSRTPDELFEVLLSDYRSYEELRLTKGCREVTEEDERQAEILCQSFRERWKEEEK